MLKKLKYADYLVHLELFYRVICNLEILPKEDLDFVKTKTNETVYLHSDNTIKTHNNIFLKKNLNKDIVIQNSDKSNSIVIADKDIYIKRLENNLSDQRKFDKVI